MGTEVVGDVPLALGAPAAARLLAPSKTSSSATGPRGKTFTFGVPPARGASGRDAVGSFHPHSLRGQHSPGPVYDITPSSMLRSPMPGLMAGGASQGAGRFETPKRFLSDRHIKSTNYGVHSPGPVYVVPSSFDAAAVRRPGSPAPSRTAGRRPRNIRDVTAALATAESTLRPSPLATEARLSPVVAPGLRAEASPASSTNLPSPLTTTNTGSAFTFGSTPRFASSTFTSEHVQKRTQYGAHSPGAIYRVPSDFGPVPPVPSSHRNTLPPRGKTPGARDSRPAPLRNWQTTSPKARPTTVGSPTGQVLSSPFGDSAPTRTQRRRFEAPSQSPITTPTIEEGSGDLTSPFSRPPVFKRGRSLTDDGANLRGASKGSLFEVAAPPVIPSLNMNKLRAHEARVAGGVRRGNGITVPAIAELRRPATVDGSGRRSPGTAGAAASVAAPAAGSLTSTAQLGVTRTGPRSQLFPYMNAHELPKGRPVITGGVTASRAAAAVAPGKTALGAFVPTRSRARKQERAHKRRPLRAAAMPR